MSSRRTVGRLWLCFLLLGPAGASAQADVSGAVGEWLSTLVEKVGTVGDAKGVAAGEAGVVVVEMRIAVDANGTLRDVSVERGSGSRRADEGAVATVRAAAPFRPPPEELLTGDGTVVLTVPIEVARHR